MSPDFQDPPPAPNYPPYFVDSDPYRETTVKRPALFRVTVVDPNPDDSLYVRWVSDYPPYTQADSRQLGRDQTLAPARGRATDVMHMVDMDCSEFAHFAPGVEHRLVVIVSDRPFLPPEQAPDREHRFNAIAMDPPYQALMASWNVIECP